MALYIIIIQYEQSEHVVSSTLILDNAAEVDRQKAEVRSAIAAIESYSGQGSEKASEVLVQQMLKLKDIENISTAAEGFVFDFDGVVCDSTNECMVTAWNAWERWNSREGFRRSFDEFTPKETSAFHPFFVMFFKFGSFPDP